MIKTTKMHKMASYNYYGIEESLYKKGARLYMSIIDRRNACSKLDGVYDELGVRQVSTGYAKDWMTARGITA